MRSDAILICGSRMRFYTEHFTSLGGVHELMYNFGKGELGPWSLQEWPDRSENRIHRKSTQFLVFSRTPQNINIFYISLEKMFFGNFEKVKTTK